MDWMSFWKKSDWGMLFEQNICSFDIIFLNICCIHKHTYNVGESHIFSINPMILDSLVRFRCRHSGRSYALSSKPDIVSFVHGNVARAQLFRHLQERQAHEGLTSQTLYEDKWLSSSSILSLLHTSGEKCIFHIFHHYRGNFCCILRVREGKFFTPSCKKRKKRKNCVIAKSYIEIKVKRR